MNLKQFDGLLQYPENTNPIGEEPLISKWCCFGGRSCEKCPPKQATLYKYPDGLDSTSSNARPTRQWAQLTNQLKAETDSTLIKFLPTLCTLVYLLAYIPT